MSKRVTIKDIAFAAGITPQAVSRALSKVVNLLMVNKKIK